MRLFYDIFDDYDWLMAEVIDMPQSYDIFDDYDRLMTELIDMRLFFDIFLMTLID